MPVWGFSAPTPVPELWRTCVCGTNSATSWCSWGLLPRPPLPFPRELQVPSFPWSHSIPTAGSGPSASHLQDPGSDAFARHCVDNPGCLSPHHGGDALAEVLARAAPGVGNHLPRQDQLLPSCATSSHTQQLPNTSFPLLPTRKEEAKPLNE